VKNDLSIGGTLIRPGEQCSLELPVSRLPSGTPIHMPVHVFRSRQEGPAILLSGGMHGDEVNGIEIIRKFLKSGIASQIRRGSIIAMPIINVYGFINFSRDVPDGKDVNRSFPGNPDGSLASIVAHTMSTCILPEIDFGIDFHTGGASRTNYPQIRYEEEDELAEEVSRAFAAPFTLHSNVIEGSFRETARSLNKSVMVFEGGETLRLDRKTVEEGLDGIKRVLQYYGMISKAPKQRQKQRFFRRSTWLRADVSGLFRHRKESGQAVKEGLTLGYISSPTNEYSVKMNSPVTGHIIGHNNFPLIHKGDALFHIGYEETAP
jgi:predicted deacylase